MDHTPLMVVLGHQRCGAVTAAVKSLEHTGVVSWLEQ
ncbi:carbonic anhydrase [Mycobacteroides abscessus subsp. abscessus]|nr:carbonic anhydrase [Mycobacteroides abscessus subsp. abscessus]